MAEDRICRAEPLEGFVAALCRALGAADDVAREVGRHLVRANLSGHDSHGVLRMAQYVQQAERGDLVPSARPTILRETAVTALVDANRCFGPFGTMFALDWALGRAREHGLAAATIRHSAHIGRLGEYAERAAGAGQIGIVTVGMAGPDVGVLMLYGARGRFFGANPYAIGVPAHGRPPMVFDGSTATVAEGKVRFARARGAQLPEGCIVDAEGRPSTDPADFYAGGALTPLGGTQGGHKGYGLALASALLGGVATIDDTNPTLAGASVWGEAGDTRGRMAGVFLVVIDPAAFGDPDEYARRVADTFAAAKRMPTASGIDEVLIPGEPEERTRAARERDGIVLPAATWQELATLADRLNVPMPACV